MATCYLFAKLLGEDNYLSLRLNSSGEIEQPLRMRTPEEIKQLGAGAQTVIVLPTEVCTLHEVEMPWVSEAKAAQAIPYALEEQVAQNIENLHFAFDRNHYQNHRYLVAAIDKNLLTAWIKQLKERLIHFDIITLDWFALEKHEALIRGKSLLLHESAFKGVLISSVAFHYLEKAPKNLQVLTFADSEPAFLKYSDTHTDSSVFIWLAKRLQRVTLLNLCQGQFQQLKDNRPLSFWYKSFGLLLGIWFLIFLLVKTGEIYTLNQQINSVDKRILEHYRYFFPNARHLINPKFRINQLLKNHDSASEEAFWALYTQLAKVAKAIPMQLLNLHYHAQTISLRLIIQDFATLEQLQKKLREYGLKTRQTNAALKEGKVWATLELKR